MLYLRLSVLLYYGGSEEANLIVSIRNNLDVYHAETLTKSLGIH